MSAPSQENQLLQGPITSPEYASASWEDGESIPDFSLDTTIAGKYKELVSNILSKHCAEVKTTSDEVVQQITTVSKKKLRELIQKHNNELFAFMARPDKTPTMIGLAETMFRRYGHDVPSIKGSNSNQILRDLNLDVSMCSTVSTFDEGLKKFKTNNALDDYLKQTRWMFNQYRTIGEEVLRLETVLFQKLEILDKLNGRIPMITSLTSNEMLPELIETFGKYADTVYKSTQIEDTYKELVETYKKWNICRQVILSCNNFKNDNQNPQCSICLTDSVTMAIVPCGHTFCASCIKKQNTTCFICRNTIRERIKLYFT